MKKSTEIKSKIYFENFSVNEQRGSLTVPLDDCSEYPTLADTGLHFAIWIV